MPEAMEKEASQDKGTGEGEVTWRTTLGDATESAPCHLMLMALLLIDICVIGTHLRRRAAPPPRRRRAAPPLTHR